MTTGEKWVYMFDEGNKEMRDLLGGKGAGLAEMTRAGLPVPYGFKVTTRACIEYLETGTFPPGLREQILEALRRLEERVGKRFGDPTNPLLVSVRSGARASMPGMMDTVLNLGMNDEVAEGMVRLTNNPRFVYDAYRRFIMMFSDVVMGVHRERFEELFQEKKRELGVTQDVEVDAKSLKELVEEFKALYQREKGEPFPQEPLVQLFRAVEAVFRSWNNPRAVEYRRQNKIPHSWGTAVNVQMMVFGNMGNDSGTGVAFTRNPATGAKELYGEFLQNAQGEDVVAGIRTPMPIARMREVLPEVYEQFVRFAEQLERHYKDVQDLEFTVERGRLYMLQTRSGKRTAVAAFRIATDLVDEGIAEPHEALLTVDPHLFEQLLHPQFDLQEKAKHPLLATGVNASPGAAAGRVVFEADDAVKMAQEWGRVLLVRRQTEPDDIHGMAAAQGILTSIGGATSHAAVVARGMGKPCVAGCGALQIDYEKQQFTVEKDGKLILVRRGDYVSIDGTTGEVFLGDIPTVPSEVMQVVTGRMRPEESEIFQRVSRVLQWADEYRALGVRANADTPRDAMLARRFGAEGVGLCRTEHMFFGEERIPKFQRMILAETREEREAALADLQPFQQQDFEGILEAMDGLPVIIRLLDPPLHEFLPQTEEDIQNLSAKIGIPAERIREKVRALHEVNPMLGHRGCRLGITYPEIYRMQVRAIYEAAAALKKRGLNPVPEVMIPLVGIVQELEVLKEDLTQVAQEVLQREGVDLPIIMGTMIEVPRAALTADEIAQHAAFFSFGTNDLTQTTFGFSRDDAEGKFLDEYITKRILETNPFEVLDRRGVGELVKLGTQRGRQANPNLEVGICGEHGGEPLSVAFCHEADLDYVSCSPPRVPIARLAAAQAQIRQPRQRRRKSPHEAKGGLL